MSLFRPFLLALAVAVAAAGCGGRAPAQPVPLRVADTRVPGSLPLYVALDKGFFAQQGLRVSLISQPTGMKAIGELASGNVEAATATDVSATVAILSGRPVSIAAALATSDSSNAVVARRDAGIASPADLRGKRIGVTPRTTADYLLDLLLLLNRIERRELTVVPLEDAEIIPALGAGKVDAVAVWQPLVVRGVRALAGKAVVFSAADFFDSHYLLLLNRRICGENPQILHRLLAALVQGTRYIAENPAESRQVLERYVPDAGREALAGYRFDIQLDHSLLISMRNQAAWARQVGYERRETPNFIDSLCFSGLEALDPSRVTVIR